MNTQNVQAELARTKAWSTRSIGLPTPPPAKLTVDDIDDIPEEVQEKIYQDCA